MFYSPLRYPGGKGKLAPLMKFILQKLSINNGVYIEPFAGGAAIAINLLLNNDVDKIIINDYDKGIAAFWNAILNNTNKFIRKMYETPVNIEEWKYQKSIYLSSNSCRDFDYGFATFYLNRTNRSGIIPGGAIGGLKQKGDWKIDARFNKIDLEKRIVKIAERKKDIMVYNKDVNKFIMQILPKYSHNALVYFDPPYFNKGKQLYKNFFKYENHKEIENYISKYVSCNWIITYDNTPEINRIYEKYIIRKFDLNYSAGKTKLGSELMIFPNNHICPKPLELINQGININYRL